MKLNTVEKDSRQTHCTLWWLGDRSASAENSVGYVCVNTVEGKD